MPCLRQQLTQNLHIRCMDSSGFFKIASGPMSSSFLAVDLSVSKFCVELTIFWFISLALILQNLDQIRVDSIL
jgi:hypothetical protein